MDLKEGNDNNFQKNVLMTSISLLHKENLPLEGDGLLCKWKPDLLDPTC